MNWKIKPFRYLDNEELYGILALQSKVFIVEQACIYNDTDGKDTSADHLFMCCEGRVLACCRIFGPGKYFDRVSIGRVAVDPVLRGNGAGRQLMERAIGYCDKIYTGEIEISAQKYLEDFYSSLGFAATGAIYLEDGIPHIRMIRPRCQ